jgi:hypothetical protein
VVIAVQWRGTRPVALVRHVCGHAAQHDVAGYAAAVRWMGRLTIYPEDCGAVVVLQTERRAVRVTVREGEMAVAKLDPTSPTTGPELVKKPRGRPRKHPVPPLRDHATRQDQEVAP